MDVNKTSKGNGNLTFYKDNNKTCYKHDTIVNLFNDIKLYDKTAEAQTKQVEDVNGVELQVEEDVKDVSSNQALFRRPVFVVGILIITVAIFILCLLSLLARETHADNLTEDSESWTKRKQSELNGNFVKMDNLWDG